MASDLLAQFETIEPAMNDEYGNIQLTVYGEAEYGSWTATYNNADMYEWFLSHHRVAN
ncbi:MAG: hypothetical protein H8E66_31815 [Planctomycetes bacterium]|nr:hypothetical protein [Planctomycetota bacterium]